MAVPFSYSFRNLWKRRLTTILTVSGMALVVFVFAAVLMMAAGLQKTLVETGSPNNVVVVRKGSTLGSDEQDRAQFRLYRGNAAAGGRGRQGQPMMAKESVVLIALKKEGQKRPPAIPTSSVRGIQAESLPLRPQVKLVAGRMLRMGSSEVIVGNSIAKGFQGVGLQQTLNWGMRTWTVCRHL